MFNLLMHTSQDIINTEVGLPSEGYYTTDQSVFARSSC